MKKILVLLSVPLLFNVKNVFAQDAGDNNFWKHLIIRKSFESLDDRQQPAAASLTLPRDKASSYLINGGLSFRLATVRHHTTQSEKMAFEPFFVFNRNTQIDAEQFNYKAGIYQNWKIGHLDKPERQTRYFNWSNSVEYMRDRMDSSHSLIVTTYLSQISSSAEKGSLYVNTYKNIGQGGFQYFISWNAGLEYQDKFRVRPSGGEGSVVRACYNVGARLALKTAPKGERPALGSRLAELSAGYTGRYDFINSTDTREGYLPLFIAELALYPTLSDDFSIGFSYNNGSDPLSGLPEQDFFQLAIRFRR